MSTTTISAPVPEDDGDDAKNLPGYKVLGIEGQGGLSTVFRARQLSLNRIVALRTVREGVSAESSEWRLRQEAAILAQVQHPHVNSILDCREHAGQVYLVLEYIPGGSLAKQIKGQPQPVRTAATLVRHLAQTVAHIHKRGVIHCNLKPQKILLAGVSESPPHGRSSFLDCEDLFGIPLLSGFELALDRGSLRDLKQGEIRGTSKYMAPEQASGRSARIGPATDIYGLGGILYELLAGRAAFEGATANELLQKIIQIEPELLHKLNPDIHPKLAAICHRCLQKEPTDRYAEALDLANDLRSFLEHY